MTKSECRMTNFSSFCIPHSSFNLGLMRTVTTFLACLCLSSCGPSSSKTSSWNLTTAPLVSHWQEADIERNGGITHESDGFTLKDGSPMTGIVFPTWVQYGLPLINYTINYDAMRVRGTDFFGSATFPVGDAKRCITFVLGGWGGAQVGISCIDGYDAAENTTGSSQRLENGRWYHVRIDVREKELRVLLDDKPIIQTNLHGRSLSLRAGDISKCAPFGFATYGTEGRVRNVVIATLDE